jgi:Tol biopolymer transport system component
MLQRALRKDRRQRLSDIRDAQLEIEDALNGSPLEIQPALVDKRQTPVKWLGALSLTGLAVIAMLVPTIRHLRETLPAEMRLEVSTPATSTPDQFALSPDGKYIAFIASGDGTRRLWLRSLDNTEARPLAGTEGAAAPFWSSDSLSIGFFASTRLYRIDIAGGPPQVLANAPQGFGGTWNADGTILFSFNTTLPIMRVSALGGVEPVAVTHLVVGRQASHFFPQFLPDGRHFLYYSQGITEATGLYLGSLEGGEPKRLTAADSQGAYMDPDMVLFVRQGTLVARRLDLKRGELTGDPMTLANSVGENGVYGAFSVSHNHVAYRSGGSGLMQLTWFDRSGKAFGHAGEPDTLLVFPDLSPDGRRVAVTRTVQGNQDIFLMDLVRGGGFTRFTFDPTSELSPVWSPDGTQVVFTSNLKGIFDLYSKPANGVGAAELLLGSQNAKVAQDWSRDGGFLLYYEVDAKGGRDLWAMEMNGNERKRFAVANTPSAEETMAQFSPDGHFVAYQTNESGMFQIVVQTFPQATGKWQVSTGGGVEPRWRADGKELYFISYDAKLMAATVKASGTTFEAGIPVPLFQTRIVGGAAANYRPQYDVSRDGRFLINQWGEQSTASPIVLILNWKPPEK